MYTEPSWYPHTRDFSETSARTVWLILCRVSSISASGILLRQRTVALLTLARSDPRGSVFLNRYDTGSLIHISYQMPIPIGAPSSELTGSLRRYSWSMRRSSTWHWPNRLTMNADG